MCRLPRAAVFSSIPTSSGVSEHETDNLHEADTAGLVPCPFCRERIAATHERQCPVCLGDLTRTRQLRESAWRRHDDRADIHEFHRWLAGEFEVPGLVDPPEPPDPAATPLEGEASSSPAHRGSAWEHAGDVSSNPAAGGEQPSTDDTGASDSSGSSWPPRFSPGLRINFNVDRTTERDGRVTGPTREARGQPGRDVRSERLQEHGRGVIESERRRSHAPQRPPVLIVEGPGPVLFQGRQARSVIIGGRELLIGRESPDAERRVDVDLGVYHGYDRLIARKHARIFVEQGIWFLEDFADNDATRLEGRRRPLNAERVPLRDGDRLIIGDSIRLRFHLRR